jgi:CheY-like chemotaxis protein
LGGRLDAFVCVHRARASIGDTVPALNCLDMDRNSFCAPLVDRAMHPAGPGSRAANRAPVVLVIEGDVLIRMAVSAYLRECGLSVIEAVNADEAIAILQADIEVDVALIDLGPAGTTDGFAVAQWIRRERKAIRTIMTSGVARTAQEAHHLCEEDGPVVAKPYDHGELERRIRQLLARERPH